MDNILSCPMLYMLYTLLYTYTILLPPFIYSLILHSPRIFYTTLIYSLICLLYALSLIYLLLYIPLYTLLYTLMALLILPRHFIPLLYLSLSLIYLPPPLIYIFLYSYIVILTLLYRKGITTLPPIFTRFTSLS